MTATPAGAALLITPLEGMPEVRAGDDLAEVIAVALSHNDIRLRDGDVLVVSSKIASKALGLTEQLRSPADKVALVLAESRRVVAERRTEAGVTRIVEALAGPVMAAAGVDASNIGSRGGPAAPVEEAGGAALEQVLVLPHDPDAVSRDLLARLSDRCGVRRIGIVLSDTAGRAWRAGQTDFALGAAGIEVLDDLRGGSDADGRPLAVTARAVADELAAAADLVKGKVRAVPVAHLRGLRDVVLRGVDGSVDRQLLARTLVRTGPGDFFGHGRVEAVRAALGAEPGSAVAQTVGIPALGVEETSVRLARAVTLALLGDESCAVDIGPSPGRTAAPAKTAAPQAVSDAAQWRVVVTGADPVAVGAVSARFGVACWPEGLAVTKTTTSMADGENAVTSTVVERPLP